MVSEGFSNWGSCLIKCFYYFKSHSVIYSVVKCVMHCSQNDFVHSDEIPTK